MNIKIICIGKIKEKYLVDGILEYSKRLKLFCDLEIIELKETNTDDINKNIEQEGDLILNNIKKNDYVIFKMIGLNNKDCKLLNYIEIFLYGIICCILLVVLSIIISSEKVVGLIRYDVSNTKGLTG